MYSKVTYSEWRGDPVKSLGSKGGTAYTVDGVDIWTSGEPNRPCVLTGMLEHRFQVYPLTATWVGKIPNHAAKIAKKHGADAILKVGEQDNILGTSTFGSAFSSASGNYSGNTTGFAQSGYVNLQHSGTANAFGTGTMASSTYVNKEIVSRFALLRYSSQQ